MTRLGPPARSRRGRGRPARPSAHSAAAVPGCSRRLMATASPAAPRRALMRALRSHGVRRRIFIPFSGPWRAVLGAQPEAELWYWCWDRFDHAYDASPPAGAPRRYHQAAAERRPSTIAASVRAGGAQARMGREADSSVSADVRPPISRDGGRRVARHLGRRTDWALLRAVSEGMPSSCCCSSASGTRTRCAATRTTPRAVPRPTSWLGARSDEEAARSPVRRRRDRPVPRGAVQRRRAPLQDPQVRAAQAPHVSPRCRGGHLGRGCHRGPGGRRVGRRCGRRGRAC